jgi:hypothetical protein
MQSAARGSTLGRPVPALNLAPRQTGRYGGVFAGALTLASRSFLLLMVAGGACARSKPISFRAYARATLIPDLRIDGYHDNLSPISYVTVGPDGTIIFDQPQDDVILFYAPDGVRIGSFGRPGGGPGEFQALRNLGWIGDTLWAFDGLLFRFSLISSSRKLVATVRLPLQPHAPSASEPIPRVQAARSGRLLPGRDMLMLGWLYDLRQFPQFSELLRGKDYVWLQVAPDGSYQRLALAWSVFGEQCMVRHGRADTNVPECASPVMDFGDGNRTMATIRTNIDGPRPGTYVVTLRHIAGDTVFSRRYPFESVPLPNRIADSIRNRMLRGATGDMRSLIQHLSFPPIYRPVKRVRVGRDGTTWVGLRQTAEGLPWLALDQAGNPIGEVILPPTVVLWVADRHTIWGVDWDQNDMPSIVRYQITWPK